MEGSRNTPPPPFYKETLMIRELIRTLACALGNKRYLTDLEKMLERLELSGRDKQTLQYLIQDIRHLKTTSDKNKQPWRKW